MGNKKTLIEYWTNFLVNKNLDSYHAKQAAIVFVDQLEEAYSKAIGNSAGVCHTPIKSNEGNVWVDIESDLPPTGTMVDGFNEIWINEDFNPEGIRECFLNDEKYWTSAEWNNDQDTWDADSKFAPTHWKQRIPPYKDEQPITPIKSNDVSDVENISKSELIEFITALGENCGNDKKMEWYHGLISDIEIAWPKKI